MGLFRRQTIFHAEDALPDPEELKLRFRRRILFMALLGFILVLAVPVSRELRLDLHARAEARRFTEKMLETRTLAASARMPVSMEIVSDGHSWKRSYHPDGENCQKEGSGPSEWLDTQGISWRIQAKSESGEISTGKMLCWHPRNGLMLDSKPIGDGQLLITLASETENPAPDLAFVLATQGGAEMQTLSR